MTTIREFDDELSWKIKFLIQDPENFKSLASRSDTTNKRWPLTTHLPYIQTIVKSVLERTHLHLPNQLFLQHKTFNHFNLISNITQLSYSPCS